MYDHWFSFSVTAFFSSSIWRLELCDFGCVEDTVVQVDLIYVYVGDLACLI